MEDVIKIFINHTNHSSKNWSGEQLSAAQNYGEIKDFSFPNVPPEMTTQEVDELVAANVEKIVGMSPTAVLCQGEFTYTFKMVAELKRRNILAVAACTERVSSQTLNEDGSVKIVSLFRFVQFRPY